MKRKIKNKPLKYKNWLFVVGTFLLVIISIFIVWVSTLELPDFKTFSERKLQNSTKIYDRTGQFVLYDINKDMRRTVVPLENIGINIRNATIAIEDSEFYDHKGIRLSSIIRATIWTRITGKKIQGGSTITQQLIKNTLLTPERSITRKVKEWVLAIKLEKILSKDKILELYLNEAPYGGSIYGIEEASKMFFGKNSKDLNLVEAAYLAAIPNAPTYYSPYGKNKEALDSRKNLVLKRQLDLGFITKDQYDDSINKKISFLPQQPTHISAPHFVFFIKDYLEKKYGEEVLENGGLKVISTIDYELQKKTEEIALEHGKINEKEWGGKNTAIVVIDPKTGQILTMVGSRDYFDKSIDGNFNVTTAERQPGSSFKPIVYALALKKGYTPETVLFDVKTEFNASCSPDGKTTNNSNCYSPDNYDNSFRGPMSLKDGLAQSINIIAVKLLYLVGVKDSINFAKDLGITTLNDPERYGLSLVIGGGETTLLDMTSVYSVFANNGIRNPYTGILSIEDSSGQVLEKFEEKSYQVVDANTTHNLNDMLSDNKARIPTFGASSPLVVPGYEVAVKTGTTNSNRDAWTIGYTPNITVGVWVGNNDNTPMKKGGAALAGPIWNKVISLALKNKPIESFEKPESINQSIPPIIRGFWQGGETFTIDTVSKKLATKYTPEENKEEISITNVHSILYWINKENPLVSAPGIGVRDSQYRNWEYGVSKWWNANSSKYKIFTNGNKPSTYDTIHTESSKPIFQIIGLSENETYDKNSILYGEVVSKKPTPIKKIDIYINNIYYTSLKNNPFTFSFNPSEIDNISEFNSLKIIGIDNLGNKGEFILNFLIK
jgi:1A family penicillin-binding protein